MGDDFAVALNDEVGGEEWDGNAEEGGKKGAGEDDHDAVGAFAFAEHFDERDGRSDDRDDHKDDVDDDGEAKIIEVKVGGDQAIEPARIEQEEQGDEIANGDIASEALTDDFVIPSDEREDGFDEADDGDDKSGKAKSAEHDGQRQGHVRHFQAEWKILQPKRWADENAKIDAEITKTHS